MSKTLILALFACVLVTSLPTEDASQTEELMQKQHLAEHKAAQKKVTNFLAQGNDENACSEMAQTALDEVSNSVKVQQDALDEMDKGAGCQYAGEKIIGQAQAKLNQTATAVEDANEALSAAKSTEIDLGTYKWDQLNADDCSSLVNIQSFKDATKVVDAAQSALGEASGAKSAAEQQVKTSAKEAAEAVTQCKCNVIAQQQEVLDKMNANAEDTNTKAWHQAKHIQCVLAGTSAGNCDLGEIPKVEESKLHETLQDTSCAGGSFEGTLQAKAGVPLSTYEFQLQALDFPGDGNSYTKSSIVGCKRLGASFLPVCDHPSYCKDDGTAWYIGQDHHISHGSHMKEDGYFPGGWSDIKLNFYGHCYYTANHGGENNDLCNNDASGNGNGYDGPNNPSGVPWESHAWLHPSQVQSTGVDGEINAGHLFMCAKRYHTTFQVELGAKNGVPARTVQFKMMTALDPGQGEMATVMRNDCNSIGMKPVCDHPSYCKTDSDALYIGQDHHMAHSPHRRTAAYWPSGWQKFIDEYYPETRGMCAYTGAHNGVASTLCNGYTDSHEWNTAQQRHEWMCGKVIG